MRAGNSGNAGVGPGGLSRSFTAVQLNAKLLRSVLEDHGISLVAGDDAVELF
jgi:hypothetical protein